MVRGDRCCIGTCDNDTRYKERFVVKGHFQNWCFIDSHVTKKREKLELPLYLKEDQDLLHVMVAEFAQIILKTNSQLQWIQIQRCGWPFKITEKIKCFINRNPPERVFTENVEANKKEAGKKPLENVQKEENVTIFCASTNDDWTLKWWIW